MTPPPEPTGVRLRDARAEQTSRTSIDRPETPPRVRAKLEEGERLYGDLAEEVREMRKAQREDAKEMRDALRDHETRNAAREKDLRAEIVDVRGEVRGVSAQVASLRADIDKRLDSIEKAIVYRAGTEGGPMPTPPKGVPLSSHQPRRATAAGAGVGGLSVAGVLAYVAQLNGLPLPLQWALAVVAVIVAVAGAVIAVRVMSLA